MGAAERQTVVDRSRCGWCGESNRWPDRCPDGDAYCADEEIPFRCSVGDHRRCSERTCSWAKQWLAEVISVGLAACARAGSRFAVVSLLGEEAVADRCFARLQQAKPYRTRVGRAAGLSSLPEIKGKVLIVREDGWLV